MGAVAPTRSLLSGRRARWRPCQGQRPWTPCELVALLHALAVDRPPLPDAATGWQLVGLGWRNPADAWPLLLPIGALDVAGSLAYNQGITGAYVSIVAPLGACFIVVTMALAALLGERPAVVQWVGIALVLGGVATLAVR